MVWDQGECQAMELLSNATLLRHSRWTDLPGPIEGTWSWLRFFYGFQMWCLVLVSLLFSCHRVFTQCMYKILILIHVNEIDTCAKYPQSTRKILINNVLKFHVHTNLRNILIFEHKIIWLLHQQSCTKYIWWIFFLVTIFHTNLYSVRKMWLRGISTQICTLILFIINKIFRKILPTWNVHWHLVLKWVKIVR